jgi:hypothetical protein
MSNSRSKTPNLKDRLLAGLRRDPKKASILGVLALVFLIVGVREVARRTGSPSAGSAATSRVSDAGGATGLPGPANALQAPGLPKGGNRQADSSTAIQKVPVDRDIFTPNVAYFPVGEKTEPGTVVSSTQVIDPTAKAEAARQEVQARAKALSLQSTVIGAVPTAIVNGRVLRVGDWISDFQVVEINSRSCQLEKSGIRVVLEMAN